MHMHYQHMMYVKISAIIVTCYILLNRYVIDID